MSVNGDLFLCASVIDSSICHRSEIKLPIFQMNSNHFSLSYSCPEKYKNKSHEFQLKDPPDLLHKAFIKVSCCRQELPPESLKSYVLIFNWLCFITAFLSLGVFGHKPYYCILCLVQSSVTGHPVWFTLHLYMFNKRRGGSQCQAFFLPTRWGEVQPTNHNKELRM